MLSMKWTVIGGAGFRFFFFFKAVGDLNMSKETKRRYNGGWGNTCLTTKFPGTQVFKCWPASPSLENSLKHRPHGPAPESLVQGSGIPRIAIFSKFPGAAGAVDLGATIENLCSRKGKKYKAGCRRKASLGASLSENDQK